MFKSGSCESELLRSMEKTLVKSQSEATGTLNRLAKATDLLSDAACIFQQAGMAQEAKMVIQVLNSVASELDVNSAKSISWHSLANETKHYLAKMDPEGGWQHVDPKKLIPQLDGSASAADNATLMLARHLSSSDFSGAK